MKINSMSVMLLVLLFSAGFEASAGTIGVAATVQGEEIKEAKLQSAVEDYLGQQGAAIGAIRDPKRYHAIREQVLDVLIAQELLWQAAKTDKVVVENAEVDLAYKRYQEQFDDEMSFNIKLEEEGFTQATFRESLKQQLSVQKWIDEFVYKDLAVTDADVHTFYVENKQKLVEPEKVRARHILIQVKPDAGNEEKERAKSLLADIKKQLDSGAAFEDLAKKYSQDTSAAQGGDLGYFTRGTMVKPFETAAFSLAPGQISEIIETRFGFHLITVVDNKPATPFEEGLISEQIRSHLWQKKSQQAIEDTVARLKKTAVIEKNNM